jgi:TolB-like protein/predicted Zn-dependent protease
VLLLAGGGIFWWHQRAVDAAPANPPVAARPGADATDSRTSIAVLPFENPSRLEDDAFFVDGVHDDILTQLTKIGALKFIARTSVEQVRDTNLTTREIGQRLGVAKIVEGGVQRAGDRVRVTVQLIDATTDAHLWAENYDRELTTANIFAIQSEVAAAIAAALRKSLTPAEQGRVRQIPTQSLDAWEAYQLGKQRMVPRTSAYLIEAARFFQTAIAHDPRFALAYVGLADALYLQIVYGGAPRQANLARAGEAVERALALDPRSAKAWTTAAALADRKFEFDRAEQMFRRAIELNPNYATAHHWYAYMLRDWGHPRDALSQAEIAVDLDPLSARAIAMRAQILHSLGRPEDAISAYAKAIQIDPASYRIWLLRDDDLRKGDLATARARYAKAYPELLGKQPPEVAASNLEFAIDLALVLQQTGESHRATVLLNRADEVIRRYPRSGSEGGGVGWYMIEEVSLHALRGDRARALVRLRAMRHGGSWTRTLAYHRDLDPNLASIRNEPEFRAIFADIERDMARQRAELAARPKDAKLEL